MRFPIRYEKGILFNEKRKKEDGSVLFCIVWILDNLTHLLGLGSLPESVLEPPSHSLEVLHPSGSGGATPLSLLGPVVRADLLLGVGAHGAFLLLDVVRRGSAATADGVRLVVALSERGGSLSHIVCIGVVVVGWF